MKTKKPLSKDFMCCYGVSSKAGDNKLDHVLMMDYDNISLAGVTNHLKILQKEYNMSNIYIIESEHGFNAIGLDILSLSMIYNFGIDIISSADRKFVEVGFNRGYYVLRFDQDKRLVKILENDSDKYKKSLSHKLFLEWFFDIGIDWNRTFNDISKVQFIRYASDKNGYHKVFTEISPDKTLSVV